MKAGRVKEIISEYRGRCNVVGEYLALKELAIAFANAEEVASNVEALKAAAGKQLSIFDDEPTLAQIADRAYAIKLQQDARERLGFRC